ncbi:MAG: M24 family metallopeptidase [Steroidobacteraceae bacterium]
MMTRREIVSGLAVAPALAARNAALSAANHTETRSGSTASDLAFLSHEPLLNESRARRIMAEKNLDALVLTRPANVYYASNHWPQLDNMGFTESAIAILPRDAARPLALILGAFSWYYTHSPESSFSGRLIFPYSAPAKGVAETDAEPAAEPPRMLPVVDATQLTPLEKKRSQLLAAAEPVSASVDWALRKALRKLSLEKARLGIDLPALRSMLAVTAPQAAVIDSEAVLREIRLAKSPTELKIMRFAAQANIDAALAAVRRTRELGSSRALRNNFFSEAASRGNHGTFMVINTTSTEYRDDPLTDGMAFAIDCVSTCGHYHGDFGRTVFVGEPPRFIASACASVATCWQEIRAQLRPGLRFTEVASIGRATLAKLGRSDLNVSFTPHSVGLFHTDHPQSSLLEPRSIASLTLEEDMILSVDCPVLHSGMGGSIHLEDLMWIRAGGAEVIHTVPESVIMV